MDSTAVEKQVEELIEDGQPFTAWNVTTKLKQGGQGYQHHLVKKIVHAMFSGGRMGAYSQDLVQVPSTGDTAFLYYPAGMNPADPDVVSAVFGNGPAVPKAAKQASNGTLPAPKSQSSSSRPQTIQNPDGSIVKDVGKLPGSALYIPQSMAESLGIGPKDEAVCTTSNDKILISKPAVAPGMAKKIVADMKGNLRIGKTALMKVGMNGRVQIKLDGQEICISKA